MRNIRTLIICCLLLSPLIVITGCGNRNGLPVAEVTGSVMYQSKPLPGGTVVFHPINGTPGPQAMGQIKEDGSFFMETLGKPGAAIGQHKVTVTYRRDLTPAEAANLVIPDLLIPANYTKTDTTPLAFTVEANSKNNYEIVLEDRVRSPASVK